MKTLASVKVLEERVAALTLRRSAVFVSRAAWGLLQILSILRKPNVSQRIAIPSFLCQSPLAAVLRAGWTPMFCDVDPGTGNVSDSEWERVIGNGVDAVLFVHLFGNVGDAKRIAETCRGKGILFIEDAAQAYGGHFGGRAIGSHGDVAIISFGHTKLIDVGQGGMVVTDHIELASEIRMRSENYADYVADGATLSNTYRKMFYAARGQLGTMPQTARERFGGLLRIYEPLLATPSNPDVAGEILLKLNDLDRMTGGRREKALMYCEQLKDTALIPLKIPEGSVPWRVAFRLCGIDWSTQQSISDAIRKEGIDISNWYIPSHWLMEDSFELDETLVETELLSKEIFQFWVDEKTNLDAVAKAAQVTTHVLCEFGYA